VPLSTDKPLKSFNITIHQENKVATRNTQVPICQNELILNMKALV